MSTRVLIAVLLTGGLTWGLATAGEGPKKPKDEPKSADRGTLVVIDHAGKEFKITDWHFRSGTRPLGWLAPPAPPKSKDGKPGAGSAPAGPEALEMREEKSTDWQNGILTLVPLTNLKRIDYDTEKKTVKVTVLRPGEKGPVEEALTGSTRFTGINRLVVEGDADLGELGKAALKFRGGESKGGVRSIQLPAAAAVPATAGRPAVVTDTDKVPHTVFDLQPLYVVGRGEEKRIGTLLFKTTVKVDLAKVAKLSRVESEDRKGASLDFEVTLKDGAQHTLILLTKGTPEDAKSGSLQGLVGRVPAGWKLFPLHTIRSIEFDRTEPAPKKKVIDV
ncbi:MAG: hypothetical protein L0Z62_18965 [Gemmataceae bacterium]|nr:hypothetical protein [Gemmataceae bacterium]